MAKIDGIQIRVIRTEKNKDSSETKICSLYIGTKKVALMIYEYNVPSCDPSVQLIMMHGYSEKKFRSALASAEQNEDEDIVLINMIAELSWLNSMEEEFLKHIGSANAGMVALQFDEGLVTYGIPSKLSKATDEELIESLQPVLNSKRYTYGNLDSYMVFRSPEDFSRGTPITLEEIAE